MIQVGVRTGRVLQVGFMQVGLVQVGFVQAGFMQVGFVQVGFMQVGVGTGRVRTGRFVQVEVHTGRVPAVINPQVSGSVIHYDSSV